jgi:hypothetical protein
MSDVELRYFDSCPHWKLAAARLKEAMAEAGLDSCVLQGGVRDRGACVAVGAATAIGRSFE